jgi:outer membrane protein OmpA-like peptidoglycan-associated protein
MWLPASSQTDDLAGLKPSQLKSFGKNAMKFNDYTSAVMYFEKYCKLKPKDYKTAYQLAEGCRLSKNYKKAEETYRKAYELNPAKNALALFYYGAMLKSNGKYEEADKQFAKFKKEYKGKDKNNYTLQIKSNAKAAESANTIMSKQLKIDIQPLDSSINTANIEFAPVFVNDSTMIYSSLKTDKTFYNFNPEDSISDEPFRKLYKAEKTGGVWRDKGLLDGPFNKDGYHCGNGAFSDDGNRFYFTRCKKKPNNEVVCAIFVSRLENGVWKEPESLGKEVNDPQYTATQPTITFDNKKKTDVVYFISNRPGGKGGLDIWYTQYDAKKKEYRTPTNAGSKINTAGDEYTPFYDADLSTMYFSSDGWPGLGGLDIYKSNGELKKWSTPENIGSPINSGSDDLYYVINKKNKDFGFIVSNRQSSAASDKLSCCDDIYSFRWLESLHMFVKGVVTDGDSLMHPLLDLAKVQLEIKGNEDTMYVPVQSAITNKEGNYTIELIPGKDYRIVVKRDGFLSNEYTFSTKGKRDDEPILINASLSRPTDAVITLKNVYYEYASAVLTEESKNVLDTTLLRILINNPEIIIEMASHTDNIGDDKSNLKLSQHRAESVVNYLVSKDIDRERLKAKGYGEKQPIAANQNPDGSDNPEGRQLNRRTEFKIVGKLLNVKPKEDE